MNVLLTSCGLEKRDITDCFLRMLPKPPEEARATFIPTAANSPDAIEVLPKYLIDLLKCGFLRENILVYDLHRPMDEGASCGYDVIYLCGSSPAYLMQRVNEVGFHGPLPPSSAGAGWCWESARAA